MKVLHWPGNEILPFEATALTIGVFDGMHLGHQKVFETLIHTNPGLPLGAITFEPHPKQVLRGDTVPLIQPLEKRLETFAEMGLSFCMVVAFSKTFAQVRADQFWTDFLTQRLKAKHLVVGYDLCIGHKQEADARKIQEMGLERGVSVVVVPAQVSLDGEKIASTLVRKTLAEGDLEKVSRLLGRPFSLSGVVYKDRGLGKTIGFPTANLTISERQLIPSNGVYLTQVSIEGEAETYPGALNIGVRPTIENADKRTVEVHLLNFPDRDLVGKQLEVRFLSKIREEKKFNSLEQLKDQINRDAEFVQSYFINNLVK